MAEEVRRYCAGRTVRWALEAPLTGRRSPPCARPRPSLAVAAPLPLLLTAIWGKSKSFSHRLLFANSAPGTTGAGGSSADSSMAAAHGRYQRLGLVATTSSASMTPPCNAVHTDRDLAVAKWDCGH